MPLDYDQQTGAKRRSWETAPFWAGIGTGLAMSAAYWFGIAPHLGDGVITGTFVYLGIKTAAGLLAVALGRRTFGAGVIASIPFVIMSLIAICFGVLAFHG